MSKRTHKNEVHSQKRTVRLCDSSEDKKPLWVFDRIDRQGEFAFNLSRADFKHREFLEKLIEYSDMTWSEIRRQTHDDGKSKHHFLQDINALSKSAQDRVKTVLTDEDYDRIFSFAFTNKLRVIGLREREFFHVIWYDANHAFYPSKKK